MQRETGIGIRLYPPQAVPVREEIYSDVEIPPSGDPDPALPYVIVNMVSSVDGRSAVSGKASLLGSEADRRAMRTLRSKVDAVMVGAGTVRAERLSLGLDEGASGPRGSQPLAVIISSSGDLPLERNLLAHEGQDVVILSPERPGSSSAAVRASSLASGVGVRTVSVPADPEGNVDLREALGLLARECGVGGLLVEGGPTLAHAFIARDLAKELFLTIAPKMLGGDPAESPPILAGPPLANVHLRLTSVHLAHDELFLRYSLGVGRPS